MTDEAGAVLERFAYEPFGKRRFPAGSADPDNTVVGKNTDRGFTNHEHLEELGLIHMNGRIYDPAIGRFMSADPFVQAPHRIQSYNRYAYVDNNPLRAVDPSGFFSDFCNQCGSWRFMPSDAAANRSPVQGSVSVGTIGDFNVKIDATAKPGNEIGAAAAAIGAAVVTQQWWIASGGSAIGAGIAGGFISGVIGSGGSLSAGATGALSGGLFGWAGDMGGNYLTHALAGCVSAGLSGTDCELGALSAVAGKYATNLTGGNFIATVVAGGTVSVIGGDKFANGALTAAFGYLFNHCAHTECWKDIRAGICTTPSIACSQQNARYQEAYDTISKGQALQPGLGPDDLAFAGVGGIRAVGRGALSFFEGAYYSEKMLMQATEIGFHGFPQAVDGFAAAYGNLSVRVGADGVKYQWLTLPGEYLGRSGTFEFIKDSAGRINHRFFNPN